jgi:hypothetical protein
MSPHTLMCTFLRLHCSVYQGCRVGTGVQMAPYSFSVLARVHAVR